MAREDWDPEREVIRFPGLKIEVNETPADQVYDLHRCRLSCFLPHCLVLCEADGQDSPGKLDSEA